MADPTIHTSPSPRTGWAVRAAAGLFVAVCLVVATGFIWSTYGRNGGGPSPGGAEPNDQPKAQPTVGGTPLFAAWPKEQKPDSAGPLRPDLRLPVAVRVQPAAEGRAGAAVQLMQSLRGKGWHVVGLDLGDAAAPQGQSTSRTCSSTAPP